MYKCKSKVEHELTTLIEHSPKNLKSCWGITLHSFSLLHTSNYKAEACGYIANDVYQC